LKNQEKSHADWSDGAGNLDHRLSSQDISIAHKQKTSDGVADEGDGANESNHEGRLAKQTNARIRHPILKTKLTCFINFVSSHETVCSTYLCLRAFTRDLHSICFEAFKGWRFLIKRNRVEKLTALKHKSLHQHVYDLESSELTQRLLVDLIVSIFDCVG
jgi:hypothetical protein